MTQEEEPKPDYSNVESNTLQQDSRVIRYRLDTDPTIKKIEIAFRGKITKAYIDSETGEVYSDEIVMCKPKVNDVGYQGLMSWVNGILNTQGLQAYFENKEDYKLFIVNYYKDTAARVMEKKKEWGIENIPDYKYIVEFIVRMAELTLTVCIRGKMMESISHTTRTVESSSPQERGGLLGIFKR